MMDLSSLDSTLPPALADAERDMGDKFRASALNITNMYKSSLGYMKQAYGVGYAACLADVLSTVQSSMSAGQDASQTLSRLMDWAEARETAMTALAADDDETTNTPHPGKARSARPTTVPAPAPQPQPQPKEEEQSRGRPRHIPIPSSTPLSSGSSLRPEGISTPMSSSPIVSTHPLSRPPLKNRNSTSHSPTKSTHYRQEPRAGPSTSSSSSAPFRIPQSAEFNPPVVAQLPTPLDTSTASIGSKRPLLDVDMSESTPAAVPVTPARGPRSAKRRSMGLGLKEDEERSERKKATRRSHGHNHGSHHGHGHGHGQGQGHGGHGGQAV